MPFNSLTQIWEWTTSFFRGVWVLRKVPSLYFPSLLAIGGIVVFASCLTATELLHVSYDSTRALFRDYNRMFAAQWVQKTGSSISIYQSHGGSGRQAKAVIDGLNADVVSLALAYDVDQIARKAQLLSPNWQQRFAYHSAPFTSTIVLVVRNGNPHHIQDWEDIVRPGVRVVMPNPKSSGGARWIFLAAWAYGSGEQKSDVRAKAFCKALLRNVVVFDSGARGSSITFAERGMGDVLVSWESEALDIVHRHPRDKYQLVYPSVSILAQPVVAVVERYAGQKGNKVVADAYVKGLYTPAAQKLIAQHYFRPVDAAILSQYSKQFPPVRMVTIDRDFGGWKVAQNRFFRDGGLVDECQPQ